jgi:hypothetical protein
MSTLTEIESAVDRLPLEEQEALLHHLTNKVARRRNLGGDALQQWMGRLDALRTSIGTGRNTTTTDQLLQESREERS